MSVRSRLSLLPFLGLLSGCGAESPTRPGDEANTTISAPRLVEPSQNSTVSVGAAPLTLIVENTATTTSLPVTYTFEVASDQAFTNRLFLQEGVPQAAGGRTTAVVTTALESGTSYFWRARAEVSGVPGIAADPFPFSTAAAVALSAPVAISPTTGVTLRETTVEFTLAPAQRTGTLSTVSYRVELATDESLSNLVAVLTVPEQPSETRVTFSGLERGRHYYWRVKAFEGSVSSEWSAVHTFRAPSTQWPTTGEGIIAFVEANYASYLEPTSSLGERQANMAFLRDRMIEAGICGGMDVGWNLKRGGPEISVDFLTQRVNGHVEGVDIGHDYDNHRNWLNLTWASGEFPFYATYQPRPSCG